MCVGVRYNLKSKVTFLLRFTFCKLSVFISADNRMLDSTSLMLRSLRSPVLWYARNYIIHVTLSNILLTCTIVDTTTDIGHTWGMPLIDL